MMSCNLRRMTEAIHGSLADQTFKGKILEKREEILKSLRSTGRCVVTIEGKSWLLTVPKKEGEVE